MLSRRTKRRALAVTILIGAFAIYAAVAPTNYVEESVSGAQLLWSADEACLFVGTKLIGWRRSPLGLVSAFALGVISPLSFDPSTNFTPSTTVLKITPQAVEHHVLDGVEPAT
jgi:hypothetical protein